MRSYPQTGANPATRRSFDKPERWLSDGSAVDPVPGADVLARPTTAVAVLIAGFLLLRLGLMLVIGFGNDEAYTLAGSRTLQLSYFDHPPLHIWMAHFAALVFGETRWVRLPFVLLFAGTSWLLFVIARSLYGVKPAVWAVLALNLSMFFTVSAGSWVVPDGVLIFAFWQRSIHSSPSF